MNNKIEGALKNTGMSQENYLKCANVIDLEIIKLEQKLAKAVEGLKKAVSSGEFFAQHADCNRDSWNCRCSFCKNTHSSKNLREARQILKELEDQ